MIASLLLLVAALAASPGEARAPAGAAVDPWLEIDYSDLVDTRQLSHSGESVGELLSRLRSLPESPAGTAAPARTTLSLLDPLLEPYAFVLQDALDVRHGISDPPLVELGSLWQPGEAQPAWVELVRARRFLVESDGRGRFRICLPDEDAYDSTRSGAEAARVAYDGAWPILRHLFAAERRRLSKGTDGPQPLQVEVHAYRHSFRRSSFRVGALPLRVTVEDLRPAGRRPPLQLERIEEFLEAGLHLEGGRIEADGSLRLLGSRQASRAELLERPLTLADLAVAYRAVFHGGLAEPYMSLDRGMSPQTSIVNYGGRLRDTALGAVSLLCDIRFKTFSLGLDVVDGRDVRETVRDRLPEFRTHYERFAVHPGSGEVLEQQTRLWFYPDNVDLTVSRQGDLLAMRRVRMSAASERLQAGSQSAAPSPVPPWTQQTVDAINEDYDALAGIFPELADLDQVVRLLSLFTWLKHGESDGLLLPDLESLLAMELPQLTTPRRFPQLLSYNALPRGAGAVEALDRLPVGEALERLGRGARGPLPARRRFLRALAALDPSRARSAQLIEELSAVDVDAMSDARLDLLTYRAERVHMHQTVLGSLSTADRDRLAARRESGEELRFFSIGIGGLELGMNDVLQRAGGRSLGLGTGNGTPLPVEAAGPGTLVRAVQEPREAWRREPAKLPGTVLPDHGWRGGDGRARSGGHWIERGGSGDESWLWTVFGANGPEPRSRRVFLAGKSIRRIERVDAPGAVRYHVEPEGAKWRAVRDAAPPPAPEWSTSPAPAPGLVVMQVGPPADATRAASEANAVGLRLRASVAGEPRSLETEFPRRVLQRLLMGPENDPARGTPLPGFSPPPAALGEIEAMMVGLNREQRAAPWEQDLVAAAGEEDPVRLARALNVWWRASNASSVAVVGSDPASSATRWITSPRVGGGALLLLPHRAFPGAASARRRRFAESWTAGEVVGALPDAVEAELVVVVSDEPPGVLGDRLRDLAVSPALRGKLLAVWSLSGSPRQDLPASLLAEGNLAGLGIAESTVVGLRGVETEVSGLNAAWTDETSSGRRVETLSARLLWYF